jgi:phosphatidylglycerol:prolipoprotein diacylglycerol transferase
MFINNFDPVAFTILSLEIRWYSLAYIFGILIGWYLSKKFFIDNDKIKEAFDDYITYVIVGIILGGRLGYVFFYDFSYYFNNPLEIFQIWNGGMSFHGGLLGVILASILFSKSKNLDVFEFLDVIAIVTPVGLFLGRIANFINSELYGKATEVIWSVKFLKVDEIYRHPSQLYEAFLEGIVLFVILIFVKKRSKNLNSGYISGIFLIFYSIFRFICEFFRVPDEQIGYLLLNLTLGQIISIIFLAIGITIFSLKNEKK